MRRARRRHVVEMLHMAKRPFACVTVIVGPTSEVPARLIALEPTGDGLAAVGTVLISLPGGTSAPTRLAIASALVLLSRPHNRAFLRRRSSHS